MNTEVARHFQDHVAIARETAKKLRLGTNITTAVEEVWRIFERMIYLTRNNGPLWQRPWPNARLVAVCRLLRFEHAPEARHLARVSEHLHPFGVKP